MNRTDFVLIVPYQEVAAFGPRIIDAYLRSKGCDVNIVFFKGRNQENAYPSEKEISILVDLVREMKPYLVGFSVMSPFFNIARMLTHRIRESVNAPIIWGGIHPTICPEDCIGIADICCVGEGEEPIRMILENIKMKGEINTTTPNCWIRTAGECKVNNIEYSCDDLNSLPIPTLTHDNKYFINDDTIANRDPYIDYILKNKKYFFKAFRGCPFSCTYCGNKAIRDVYGSTRKYTRSRTVDNVISELKKVLKQYPSMHNIGFLSLYYLR